MPRQALTIQDMTHSGGVVNSISGTLLQVDGGVVAAGGKTRNLFLHIQAGTAAGTITILAGANPPAFRKGLGNLVIALTANQMLFFPLESARYTQTNGDIYIDTASNLVVVKPYRMPADI